MCVPWQNECPTSARVDALQDMWALHWTNEATRIQSLVMTPFNEKATSWCHIWTISPWTCGYCGWESIRRDDDESSVQNTYSTKCLPCYRDFQIESPGMAAAPLTR